MGVYCPELDSQVLYLTCLDCETKSCRRGGANVVRVPIKRIVIGIDQSYADTGVSVGADGVLKSLSHIDLEGYSCNSDKRYIISDRLDKLLLRMNSKAKDVQIIIERIRLKSDGFVSMDYIKSMGALNATIVDTAYKYDIPVYSVDTRSWKKQVVGTSKPGENPYGIDEKKWPTIEYLIGMGYEKYLIKTVPKRKKKGVITKGELRYTYNDNIADSACICLYGFISPELQHLVLEH